MSIQQTLTAEHRACDAAFVQIEKAAQRGAWDAAWANTQAFVSDTEAHFRYEEDTLFPALEAAAPMAGAPVRVMRSEHAQMRGLFAELGAAVRQRDLDAVADAVDVLLLMMQQHNAKEENVLYPLADRVLPADEGVRGQPSRKAV